jgi:hypothetical protein
MINRFLDAIEAGHAGDSGLEAGVAASVIALMADRSRLSGQVVTIEPGIWDPVAPRAAAPAPGAATPPATPLRRAIQSDRVVASGSAG